MDIYSSMDHDRAISPTRVTDNTALVSQILDTANFQDHLLLIQAGTLADADATFTVLMEHGDAANLSDAAAVPDADLRGTEAGASFTFTNDDSVRKIGYKGAKRYVRATITPANNTGNADIAAIWAKFGARKQPQTSQS